MKFILLYKFNCFFNINSTIFLQPKVQITENNLNIVLHDVIELMYCPSFLFKRFVTDLFKTLESLLSCFLTKSMFQMTIHETKCCICNSKSYRNSTFVTRSISCTILWSLNFLNSCMNRFFCKKHSVKSKHVVRAQNLILVNCTMFI